MDGERIRPVHRFSSLLLVYTLLLLIQTSTAFRLISYLVLVFKALERFVCVSILGS